MHRFRKTTFALALAALAGASPGADAATLCVTSGAVLQQALQIAAGNGESDDLRVVAGTFTTQSAPNGVRWTYVTTQDFSLVLSGGWAPGCMGPDLQGLPTVLAGQTTARILEIVGAAGPGTIVVRDLTLQGGRATTSTRGSAMRLGTTSNYTGSVTIERLRVSDTLDTIDDSAAFSLDGSGGVVTIRNSLFADNVSGVAVRLAALSGGEVRFVNNTVVDQLSLLDESSHLSAFNGGRLQLSNNVFSRNGGPSFIGYTDAFAMGTTGAIELRGNHFESGAVGTYAVNLDTSTGDARLAAEGLPIPAANSPVRNSGFASPDGGLPAEDLTRAKRVQGGRVDKGAVEFPEFLSNGFE